MKINITNLSDEEIDFLLEKLGIEMANKSKILTMLIKRKTDSSFKHVGYMDAAVIDVDIHSL